MRYHEPLGFDFLGFRKILNWAILSLSCFHFAVHFARNGADKKTSCPIWCDDPMTAGASLTVRPPVSHNAFNVGSDHGQDRKLPCPPVSKKHGMEIRELASFIFGKINRRWIKFEQCSWQKAKHIAIRQNPRYNKIQQEVIIPFLVWSSADRFRSIITSGWSASHRLKPTVALHGFTIPTFLLPTTTVVWTVCISNYINILTPR